MPFRFALDANRYQDFVTGVPDAVACLSSADEINVPAIVLGELRAGFRLGQRAASNERRLAEFLAAPRVRVLLVDESTTHAYAEVQADLRRAGTPIPTNDVWIAALAIQHGLVLYSRDRHFEHVSRLARL